MLSGSRKKYFKEFWALKDVSFSVAKGETVGIVGRNGSGKSTLLQLLCGTLNPTSGSVSIEGKIAALLELGSGFNHEFTGRENVYLYASVLGLSKEQTESRFGEIESFADIGEFIDRPTKTYSSGMVVRLAFAVAIHVDPQVLVVDEALAVGDELFQRKCYSKIEQLKQKGVTILFVSHSGSTVISLCDRAILLDRGEMLLQGDPKTVVGLYQRLIFASAESQGKIRQEIKTGLLREGAEATPSKPIEAKTKSAALFDPGLISKSVIEYESKGARITNLHIRNSQGEEVNCLVRGERYSYNYQVEFMESATSVSFGMLIKSKTGIDLGGYTTAQKPSTAIPFIKAGEKPFLTFEFDCNFNPGFYYLNAGVKGSITEEMVYLHRVLDGVAFRVMPLEDDHATGLVDFNCSSKISNLASAKAVSNL
jgi:lipopolysaccharide transport system ATP-binding protein